MNSARANQPRVLFAGCFARRKMGSDNEWTMTHGAEAVVLSPPTVSRNNICPCSGFRCSAISIQPSFCLAVLLFTRSLVFFFFFFFFFFGGGGGCVRGGGLLFFFSIPLLSFSFELFVLFCVWLIWGAFAFFYGGTEGGRGGGGGGGGGWLLFFVYSCKNCKCSRKWHNLKQNEAQSVRVKPTRKGFNQRSKDVTQT